MTLMSSVKTQFKPNNLAVLIGSLQRITYGRTLVLIPFFLSLEYFFSSIVSLYCWM